MLFVLLLVLGTGDAAAMPAGTHTDPSSATFTDATGDAGAAPDLGAIVISITSGTITFQIRTSDATLPAGRAIYVDLDTDKNAATGNPEHFGADYVLSIVGPTGSVGAVRWQNASWQSVQLASLSGAYANNLATLTVNESDLGAPTGFNFYVLSQVGTSASPTAADWAPDRGVWNFSWRTAALTLSVARFSAPRTVKAGKVFLIAMESRRSDTGGFVGVGARVHCRARLGSNSALGPRFAGLQTVGSESAAICAFRAPINARGKRIHGSLTVSFGGSSVSRAFSLRVT
jgi:hypothetical protein